MLRLRHWMWLALALVLSGLALMVWRVEIYGYPLRSGTQDPTWTVQARIRIDPAQGPVKVTLQVPANTPGLARLNEDFISRGFGVDVQERPASRRVTWSIRRDSSPSTLYYRARYYRDPRSRSFVPRPAYPEVPRLDEPFATAMRAILDRARSRSADIGSFATEIIDNVNSASPGEEVRLFLNAEAYANRKIALIRTLLAGARIPSEQINGLLLVDSDRKAPVVRWLAVHNEQQWLFFDPVTGNQELPEHLLVWWLGERPAVSASGAVIEDLQWSVRRSNVASLELAQRRADSHEFSLAPLSLSQLPVQAQTVYETLLLVPIGAFILVLLRNVVGLRAFGTFMPVLIALAFRDTGLVSGLSLFALIVTAGLLLRFYLERLRLLLVPRLAAVVTIVVMLMLLVSLLSARLNWDVGLSIGLFPIVIMAMVIERMSITWEERGPRDAMVEGAGSAVIATAAYLVMGLEAVRHVVFVFPESLLVVLGLTIAMGRYSGYRLSELIRFRALTGS